MSCGKFEQKRDVQRGQGDRFTTGERERRLRKGRRAWVSRVKESGEGRGGP